MTIISDSKGLSSTEKKYQDLLTKIQVIEGKITEIEAKITRFEADFRWFYFVPITTILLQVVTITILLSRG